MVVISCLLLLLTLYKTSADSFTDGTELLLSFMVHRHGDRTPSRFAMSYINDTKSLEQMIAPWGYGQLTNVGRRTAYKTGQFIRRRYDELLSETYNKSEIYIRSTDSTRTKMTVLCAMAAVYPAVGDTWSDDINWVPVPYNTVSANTDFNLAHINCPVFKAAQKSLMNTPSTRMEEYRDVIDKLSSISGRNMTTAPIDTFMSYELYVSEISMGMKLEEVMALMPRLEEAAGVAVDIMLGDEKNSALHAGVLLNEFLEAASSIMAGKDVQKVRVYSAHDINVYTLQVVTGVNRQGATKYGSLFSLELRKITATGKYVVVVHRHGDRTPSRFAMSYINDTKSLEQMIAPWGYGQLTNVGRRTAYKTGQFIRRRYDELLSETYNKSEIYIRSTDSTRTKMTVLCAMAAVYPAVGDTWSDDINWVPVPYTTVPANTDFNLAHINCPVFKAAQKYLMNTPSTRMEEYRDVINKLSSISGRNMTTAPIDTFMSYELYVSEISMGMKLEEVMALMPRLEEAAGVAEDIMLGDEKNSALHAGVLLNEFLEAASSIMAGKDVQKVRVYSAHDINVYTLQVVTGVNRQGATKYGSLFSLELRKITATGKYVVVPVYLPSPDEKEIYLSVKNCGGEGDTLCDFDTFNSLTSKNSLDEDIWRAACAWSPDLTFDTSSID